MIDRQLLPLALLRASGGQDIRGRTRLQKMVFLIQQQFGDKEELPGEYSYVPYDYGPFAKKLYDDLDFLEERRVITENRVTMDDKVVYYYSLGPNAEEYLNNWSSDEVDRVLEMAEHIKNQFNDVPLPNLLDYVYGEYPEYAENSVL